MHCSDSRREMSRATLTAFTLSVAVHIGVLLGFGPVTMQAPQPAAFEIVEVALVSEPPPRLPVKPAVKPRVSPSPAAAPATETATPEPDRIDPAPAPPVQGKNEPLVESRYNVSALNNPKPPYPLAARRRGQEGRVLVRAYVREDGRAGEVEIKQSSGHELLDDSARQTVQRWRFVPASRAGMAVAAWVDIPIVFRLND